MERRWRVGGVVLCLSLLGAAGRAGALSYKATDLGTLGGQWSYGYGINDSGQVAGYSNTADFKWPAFVYTPGSGMAQVGDPPASAGAESKAYGINNAGQVVINRNAFSGGPYSAFVYTPGVGTTPVGSLVGGETWGYAINASGQVVGKSLVGKLYHAYLYTPGAGMRDLLSLQPQDPTDPYAGQSYEYDVNASGQVVGASRAISFETLQPIDVPFLYTPGVGMERIAFPSVYYNDGAAKGISDNGFVVGEVRAPDGYKHAFLYTPGVGITDLGLGVGAVAVGASALAVNDAGWLVGYYVGALGGHVAFLWTPDLGMVNLNDLLEPGGAFTLSDAYGVNNNGDIVAWGSDSKGKTHTFSVTRVGQGNPVPEPATLLLLGSGLLGLGALCRWRRRS